MLLYARWGKFRHRDRMLNMVSWRGGEQVLDVGTGRGLLLIGAARRLSTGKSTGIDVWSAKDFPATRWSARELISIWKE
jgi:cyclopropane fatty-acyl-phospholipid synthase-like methyltransferase